VDLPLFIDVLRRRRWLVSAGVAIAIAITFLATFRVTRDDGLAIGWRGDETWSSTSRVFVTRPGFEWGSTLLDERGSPATRSSEDLLSEEGRLADLATLYASFVSSDSVRRLIRGNAPKINGEIDARSVVTHEGSGDVLPIVEIDVLAPSSAEARRLAHRTARALQRFVIRQQATNSVPENKRVRLAVINRSFDTKLIAARSKTLPVIAFLSVLTAFVALAFVLENLRGRPRRAMDVTVPMEGTVPMQVVPDNEPPAEQPAALPAIKAGHGGGGNRGRWGTRSS
jgi:hypothetical protein